LTHLLWLREHRHRPIRLVPHGQLSCLHPRPHCCRCVESWNSRTTRSTPLSERALWCEFKVDFTREIFPLERLVLADVGSNHFLDLTRGEEQAEAGAINTGIVGDAGKIFDVRLGNEGFDESIGDAAEAETTGEDGGIGGNGFDGLEGRGD